MKVLAISGSLRGDSYNAKLLRAAAELLPDEVELELWAGLKAVPPYDEDDDVEPAPAAVAALRAAIAGADAVLFATPEYNHSVPGQLKNALDWTSRPPATNVLRNKPVAVVGASAGAFGAVWAQAELRKVLAAIGARVIEGDVAVRHAPQRFDENGRLADDGVREQLAEVVDALVGEAQPARLRAQGRGSPRPHRYEYASRLEEADMRLEGIHHITAITADAPRNVDFYARLLGLRLVKKTVNQDDPTVYHLFYADEQGSPGADLTFFEYPGARRGRAGAGMVHRIVWRVAGEEALDFWEERLRGEDVPLAREPRRLRFSDPEGLSLELAVVETEDAPLIAEHPEIPAELALQGFDGVRAYSFQLEGSRRFLEQALGFTPTGEASYEVRGQERGSFYIYDQARERGTGGAGTVHHVAWGSPMEEHKTWRERVIEGGAAPTPVIDRYYFRSIYFREPSGVLFEIATIGPGFTADEPLEHLGERLSLPPSFEHLRERLEQVLTPLPNPRAKEPVR